MQCLQNGDIAALGRSEKNKRLAAKTNEKVNKWMS